MSNATNPNTSHSPVFLDAGPLRLVFSWQGDRWGHHIERHPETVGFDAPAERVESLEGAAQDEWPASPPFQSLHVEQRGPGKQVAFLVGMAGASHWSASVEVDSGTGQITFDVACRVKAAPRCLGSTYRRSEMLASGVKIEPLETDGLATQRSLSPTGELQLAPSSPTGPWPQTVRWQYQVVEDPV